tara:strand:- start:79 stop:402 length:324 start_codon:yes stop_codon:yes gene_type:complete
MKETITINLNEAKLLKEDAALISFGAKIKQMLYYMFAEPGQSLSTFYVKGNKPDVMAFGAALASEKAYMDSYLRHGLNDPSVLNNRYRLDKAVEKFERETGIKWPLK